MLLIIFARYRVFCIKNTNRHFALGNRTHTYTPQHQFRRVELNHSRPNQPIVWSLALLFRAALIVDGRLN